MRKCKGKSITGKDVKGWYCEVEGRHFIIPDNAHHHKIVGDETLAGNSFDGITGLVEVDPETVGEFVCPDKNGKDVYAGDKVNYASHKAIVKQNDGDFGFHLEFVDLFAEEAVKTGKKLTNVLYRSMFENIELIEEK